MKTRYPHAGQQGIALVSTVVFLLALSLMGGAYVRFVAYDSDIAESRLKDMQAFWVAEETLTFGVALLQRSAQPEKIDRMVRDTGAWRSQSHILRLTDPKLSRWQITAVVAKAETPQTPLCRLEQTMRATSATDFFWLEDHSGDRFYFTGDSIDGPIHTNTSFGIAGRPVFKDSVFEMATPGRYITHPDYAADPVLLKAKPTQGENYSLDHMARLIRQVSGHNQVKPDPSEIVDINFTGTSMEIRIRDRNLPGIDPPVDIRPIPKEGGFYVNGDVEVHGVVDRTLTLGASGNIVITQDLVYAGSDLKTGEPRPGNSVYLALIAEHNVQVKQTQTREAAGVGIRINAAIVAMDSSFEVVNIRANPWDMGTMMLWGSIAQVARGQIGSVKSNNLFRGYHKNWHYDRRLPKAELPWFPPLINAKGMMHFTPVHWGPFQWVDNNVV